MVPRDTRRDESSSPHSTLVRLAAVAAALITAGVGIWLTASGRFVVR